MNITDEHLNEFIDYTIEKMCKKRPYDKMVERDVRQFYGIFWEREPRKVLSLFKNSVPIVDGKLDRRYLRRLGKEFHLIDGKGFYKVFYQVAEILELTTDMIHVIRGSSGSSIVCYLMGITHIDPIKNNICLARFMHSLRDDMPDIDMDFPTHLRDEVYARIYRKYQGRVARISNHVHYGPKTALKQALKNNGVEGFIPKDFNYKQLIRDRLKIVDDDEALEIEAKVLEEARIYNGLEKHTSLHCGGIFIMDNKIPDDLILQEIESNGVSAYQVKLDKDETENSGFIKIDILSNRGLSQVMDIYAELGEKGIVLPRFENLPIDEKVMNSFSVNNIGLTYAESRGMAKIFKRLQPKSIDDLSTALALIRPAASDNGQKSEYLRALRQQPENPLEPNQRHWVIYDDDAIIYIQKLLNIKEDEADIYRKAFSKSNDKALLKQKEFIIRLVKMRKYSNEQIEEIINQLKCLQEYGFCKSHSYSYAYLIYALAYLKYYWPREFWKATLNYCHSSYRPWVHYREAAVHLELTHMSKPYKLNGDGFKLIPENGIIQSRLFSRPKDDFLKLKYWVHRDFLKDMYYIQTNVTDERGRFLVKFRGLIATYRPYKYQGRKITFITVGYNNSSYIDLFVYGHYPCSKWLGIEGEGLLEDDYIQCKTVKPISI